MNTIANILSFVLPARVKTVKQTTTTVTLDITSPVAKTVEAQVKVIMNVIGKAADQGEKATVIQLAYPHLTQIDDLHSETIAALAAAGITISSRRHKPLEIYASW